MHRNYNISDECLLKIKGNLWIHKNIEKQDGIQKSRIEAKGITKSKLCNFISSLAEILISDHPNKRLTENNLTVKFDEKWSAWLDSIIRISKKRSLEDVEHDALKVIRQHYSGTSIIRTNVGGGVFG